jgi:hypothetical protein
MLGIFAGLSAHASIGNVVELAGTAIIKRGSNTITLSVGTPVAINDTVVTKSGRLKIKFEDNTTVTVTESSSLLIDDFVYTPSTKSGKLGLKAMAGTVRYVSGNIAHSNPNSVKINTPTAAIAVRGTDFSMSVQETGESLIILLPTCEVENNINLRGLVCGSGRIDVESGGTTVVLDKPYQATIVETSGAPPLRPITISLDGRPVNNNLMISPPKTLSGSTIESSGVTVVEDSTTTPQSDIQNKKAIVAVVLDDDTKKAAVIAQKLSDTLRDSDIKITDVTDNQFLYKIWYDSSETLQTGVGYERLSPSGFNYANISLSMDTKSLLVVTQDMIVDAVNTNSLSSKSYGTIIINQSYR